MKKAFFVLLLFVLAVVGARADLQSFRLRNPTFHYPQVDRGDVMVIKISDTWLTKTDLKPAIMVFGNQYLPNKYGYVFIGVGLDLEPGPYEVALVDYGKDILLDDTRRTTNVSEFEYPERIRKPFAPTARWLRERREINKALAGGDYAEMYFSEEFVMPIDRIFVDIDRIIGDTSSPFRRGHNGVDLITLDPGSGKYKREVRAINSGRVALIAKNFSTEGNMLIIDHGSDIFSIYMHLAKFNVKKVGEMIKTGQVVAISGNTGNAKNGGPHLHLSVRVSGIYVDPIRFIETMNQDFMPRSEVQIFLPKAL